MKASSFFVFLFLAAGSLNAQHSHGSYSSHGTRSSYRTHTSHTKYSSSSTHLKKDGTPDRRYKGNKTYFSTPSATSSPSYKYYTSFKHHKTVYYYTLQRDPNGRIHRSQSARHAFMKMTGYPHGRPGYVIDHIIPLKRGGCDCPSNMQWQTIEDAKAKDKTECP